MTNTFTKDHRTKLEDYLSTHDIPKGLGTKESACSIAAINLAMTGTLTDDIPACMSEALGGATIRLQDTMPNKMRNSHRYKKLIPNMAGTGRNHEQHRLEVLLDWMWGIVLPQLQGLADDKGFGDEWRQMCEEKTSDASLAASRAAARAAAYAAARDAARDAARSAAYAAANDANADFCASYAARADYAANAASDAADAADAATHVANYVAVNSDASFWDKVDPIGVLERMTYLEGQDK